MNNPMDELFNYIEATYAGKMKKGTRHYQEVSLSEAARKLGFSELAETYKTASAIIPLRHPQRGMKVRIDGRTFVNYAQYESGMAVPAYLAQRSTRKYRAFIPMDSMICNYC
jgi:hypothetical protein